MFSRLISIVERTNKFKEYFEYELTQEPTSSFKDGFMRESHKSDLKNILSESAHNFEAYPASKIDVEGDSLLHQVSWNKNCFLVKSLINIVITYKIITIYVL